MGCDENMILGLGVSLPWELIQELDTETKDKLDILCLKDYYNKESPWVFFAKQGDELYLGKNGHSLPETFPLFSSYLGSSDVILSKFFSRLEPKTVEILQPLLDKYKDEVIIGPLAFHYWT
ncbi:MAG: hypothetical protein ACYCQJ_12295 [Nitrososphaerales archaeon]